MAITITIAPPIDTTNSWRNTFRKIDQEAFFDNFKNLLLADGATTATRISTACTADHTSFLIAQPNGTVKIVHHIHHDIGSAFVSGSTHI